MVFVPGTTPSVLPGARYTVSLLFTFIHNLAFMHFIRCLYSCILPDLGLSTALRDSMPTLTIPWWQAAGSVFLLRALSHNGYNFR